MGAESKKLPWGWLECNCVCPVEEGRGGGNKICLSLDCLQARLSVLGPRGALQVEASSILKIVWVRL